ncbi:SIMPL domain-containing protein [Asticcacaulis solisilvae]|uniref:SIMPL domain-containing protein n=1 Tax=Asticcacaulis solisilvae TaxID=1217274 RepID=UPI003FD86A3C
MTTPRLLKATTALAVAASLFAAPMAFAADTLPSPPMMMPTTLSLSATGQVSATPDMATIGFAVVTQGKTASDAMKANNARMNAVLAALKTAGIAAKDIRTSSLNLNPQYVYNNNQPPQLTGYEARDQITVRVNDLNQTGPVIDAVIKAGINQIDQINFGLKNDDAVLDQARQQAVATLQQRAQLYAAAAGLKVKRILNIEEGSPNVVRPPMPMMAARFKAADESTPVATGDLQESVTVSATFELQ